MSPFLRIGHRGASGHEPENTLRSIRRALELGANGIEIDVRLSLDGELVVFHDSRLRRITGTSGTIAGRTLAELRQLDAGGGEKIPTLREVFELVAGRAWLNIELKARGTGAAVLRESEWAVGQGGWNYRDIVVSSFDHRELKTMIQCAGGNVPMGVGILLARRPLSLARLAARLEAASLHLPRRLVSAGLVARAHAIGLRVFVFTVNEPEEIARLRKMGVDGVFTDYPERAVGEEEKEAVIVETPVSGIEAATHTA